jgi:hypothetical protein
MDKGKKLIVAFEIADYAKCVGSHIIIDQHAFTPDHQIKYKYYQIEVTVTVLLNNRE